MNSVGNERESNLVLKNSRKYQSVVKSSKKKSTTDDETGSNPIVNSTLY